MADVPQGPEDGSAEEAAREGAVTTDMPPATGAGGGSLAATWAGQPRALSTLFYTEMWERFSYYGMRGILVLFMTAAVTGANPGLGYGVEKASAVYGLYTAMVYLLALPGGWVADKLWGQRKAVFVGGCIIAAGHFSMAAPLLGLPDELFFFLGLLLIVIGTGLLKPNVSTIVGDLYPRPTGSADAQAEHWGAARDAGFSIFYMGINLGAIFGPFFCGLLGENYSFHWGFSLAGFGMVLGLIQYKLGDHYFGSAGLLRSEDGAEARSRQSRMFYMSTAGVAIAATVFGYMVYSGVINTTLTEVVTWIGFGILVLVLAYFAYLIFDVYHAAATAVVWSILLAMFIGVQGMEVGARNATLATLAVFIVYCLAMLAVKRDKIVVQQRRYMVIVWVFLLAALFWSGFEQAGSSMTLFAEDLTDRFLGPSTAVGGIGAIIAALITFAFLAFVWYRYLSKRDDFFLLEKVITGIGILVATGFAYWVANQISGGWEMPTSWLQTVNPIFIVIFAPIFGVLWTWLARRNANPSIPVKFSLGLLGLAAGFFVLAWGSANATADARVGISWLVVTYFLHTVGELCLSPVGLSSMTKLAPADRVGQMMGIWFVAASLGNLIAGLVAGQLEDLAPTALFNSVALIIGGGGLVALLVSPGVKRLMGNLE